MNTVYKYQIEIDDYFELDLPKNAIILKADIQFNKPVLWALIDPKEDKKEKRVFRFAGTGHPIKEDIEKLKYINTFQVQGGMSIFHIFEIKMG